MANDHREVDRISAWYDEFQARTSPRAFKRRAKRLRAFGRRVVHAFLAALAVFATALLLNGFVTPIGFSGFLLSLVAMVLVWWAVVLWPSGPEPTPEALARTDLKALPQLTEAWLERQRPALPAPAARLVDQIGVRLEALAPQLAALDPRAPAAFEVRKLVGEELPELINGYARVPHGLRRAERNGTTPDRQLVEGLQLVEEEIARLTEELAGGDLHRLATQGRFLELKYRGEEG